MFRVAESIVYALDVCTWATELLSSFFDLKLNPSCYLTFYMQGQEEQCFLRWTQNIAIRSKFPVPVSVQ